MTTKRMKRTMDKVKVRDMREYNNVYTYELRTLYMQNSFLHRHEEHEHEELVNRNSELKIDRNVHMKYECT